MTESQKMLEILHENKMRVRKENQKLKKQNKLDTIVSYIVLGAAATVFMIGIMTLIAVIENMPL